MKQMRKCAGSYPEHAMTEENENVIQFQYNDRDNKLVVLTNKGRLLERYAHYDSNGEWEYRWRKIVIDLR